MKRKVVFVALTALLALAVSFSAACGPDDESPKPALYVQNVTMSVGESKVIEPSIENYDGQASFTLSVPEDACVTADGMTLSANKSGSATVVCALVGTDITTEFTVTVTEKPSEPVLYVQNVTMSVGESKVIEPSVENYDGQASFTLSAPEDACVTVDGMTLSANKSGSATVVCALVGTEITTEFTVTVTEKPVVTVENVTLIKGESVKVVPSVENYDGQPKVVYEIVEGESFIALDGDVITALGKGVSSVRASIEGTDVSTTFTVEVKLPDYKITLDKSQITLYEGESEIVTPSVYPEEEDAAFVYRIISGGNCIFIKNGVITANENGIAVVRCYLKGYDDAYAELTVIVQKKTVTVPSGYVKLTENIYAYTAPGRYKSAQIVDFITTEYGASVYYTTDSSPVADDASNAVKWEGKKTISRRQGALSDYRLTTQVDAALNWAGPNKNLHNRYVNAAQVGGGYNLIDLAYVYNIAVVKNGEVIERTVASYILYPSDDFDDFPIISLSMPVENWFDGIPNGEGTSIYNNVYVPGGNMPTDYSARANLEFFDENGYSFSTNTQVKVGGGWSRGYPQRTLHLNFAKDENGVKQQPIIFDIFGNRTKRGDDEALLTEFSRFRLWNGGSTYDNSLRFNDAFLQLLAEDLNVATAAVKPAIVYLNGEFWGMYYMREHYSDVYFKTNYDVKKGDVQYFDYVGGRYNVEDGDEAEANAFIAEMNAYLDNAENNFADQATYDAFFDKYVDEASMIDCIIMQVWAGNWDFVGNSNNHRVWRVSKPQEGNPYTDGKLRFVLHDLDMTINNRSMAGGDNVNLLSVASGWSLTKYNLFNRALANEGFRERLYNRAVELCRNQLSPASTIDVLNKFAAEVRPLVGYNYIRWFQNQSTEQWDGAISYGRNWLSRRNDIFLPLIKTTLAICDDKSDNVPVSGGNIVYGERVFAVNQFWQGNGSLDGTGRKDILNLNLGDFEVSYRYQVNGIRNGSGQFHVKFLYNGSNYVTRILRGTTNSVVFTDVKGMSNSADYAGNSGLYEGVHKMRFVKRGTTLSVYVDEAFAYSVEVPNKNIVGIAVYQHNANVIYRDFVVKRL